MNQQSVGHRHSLGRTWHELLQGPQSAGARTFPFLWAGLFSQFCQAI